MLSLEATLLDALAGSSGQQPVKLFDLAARAGSRVPDAELRAVLDDLVARRAVNTARTSQDGHTWHDLYWLTGAPPAKLPRGITINKYTEADAKAAHEALCAASASQDRPLNPPSSALLPRAQKPLSQEPAMSRVTAEVETPVKKAPLGTVMAQLHAALAGLTEATAATPDELLAKCPACASLGSLRGTLRTLARRGDIHSRSASARGKHRVYYWPLDPIEEPARLDDDFCDTEPSDTAARAANKLGLDAPGPIRFALWDDGQLLITADGDGDSMMVLDAGTTRRLADFLVACMGAV